MALCDEIEVFANKQLAAHISARALSKLALDSLVDTLHRSVNSSMELRAVPFTVRFDAVMLGNGEAIDDLETGLQRNAQNDIELSTSQDVVLSFSLMIIDNGAPAHVLTKMQLNISALKFLIDVGSSYLKCEVPDPVIRPEEPARAADFEDLIVQYDLDRDKVTRIEGMLIYGGVQSIFAKALGQANAIELHRLFPSVKFAGRIVLDVAAKGGHLLIRGDKASNVDQSQACDCEDVGDGIGEIGKGHLGNENDPGFQLGLSTPVNDVDKILGRRRPGEGDIGLYIPNETAEGIVSGVYPAVRIDLEDNGFIGWKAAAIVDFSNVSFQPDWDYGRFYVTIDFRAEVYGSVRVDLGKLGKIRVTSFDTTQPGAGGNRVKVGFYFVVGTKGIYLKPVLEEVTFDKFEVHLNVGTLVGTPFGAWGAVIGFIFDRILE
ncbi:hypothetical protein DC415_23840, partial [Agrobacterium tumefaciens]